MTLLPFHKYCDIFSFNEEYYSDFRIIYHATRLFEIERVIDDMAKGYAAPCAKLV